MVPGGPGHRYGIRDQPVIKLRVGIGQRSAQRDDAALSLGVLVADREPAEPVMHGRRQPGGADIVVGVHRGDDAEGRAGRHGAGPRYRDLALGHGGEQGVDSVLGRPVELLDVQESAGPHRLKQRPVDEVVGGVVLSQHPGRVVVADQLGGRQVRVALDEDQRDAPLRGNAPQQGALAGAGRSLQDDVAPGSHGRQHQVKLALAADQVPADSVPDGADPQGAFRPGHRIVLPASTVNSSPVT